MSKKIPNIDFIGKMNYALIFSIALTILSLVLLIFKGLNLSIDFKGGTIIEFSTKQDDVENRLRELLIDEYRDFEIHKIQLNDEHICCNYDLKIGTSGGDIVDKVTGSIKNVFQDAEFIKIDYIGPKIGAEFAIDSAKAVVFSLLAMMAYVWFRFGLKFGFGVILALLHDVLITFGFFSLSGFQFDLTSIAVILTVVGYSINDSIVIYDRIRENLNIGLDKIKRSEFGILINRSMNETLSRTIMTSLTTLVVSVSLLIFGGEALRGFSAGLSFGIAFGTYSSIYISAPVLIFLSKK
jgi:preprotein translocase subunit SecF